MIRRYDMARSDNFPVSGTISALMTEERMFVPVGFNPKSAIVSHIKGAQVKFDGCGKNGFYVKLCSVSDGKKVEFQYMVS